MARIDITGNVYEKVTVLEYAYSVDYGGGCIKTFWKCKCACGNIFETLGDNLKKGRTKSCRCNNKSSASMREGREEYFEKGIRIRFKTDGGKSRKRIYLDSVNMEKQNDF
jgi:hypothetical protein